MLNGISMNFIECLNAQKEEWILSIHRGRVVLITTGYYLLDAKYKFYAFNDDLTDTITE